MREDYGGLRIQYYADTETRADKQINLNIIDSGNSTDILSYISYEVERVRIQWIQ